MNNTKISLIKSNKPFLLLMLFIMATIFNSCLNYYQEVTLYPDGSGKMRIDYWMKFINEESEKVVDNLGIFNPDSIRSGFQSAYSKVENVNVYRDTTDFSTHAVIDISFNHIDSLNNTKVFAEYNFSFQEKTQGQIVFSQFIPPIATGFGIDASTFNVTYQYTFSGEILSHNAHQVSGKTLTWRYSLSEIGGGKTISVTFQPYKLKETPTWIYILSGAVLLLVLFFLLKKRKS
jgi:LPXTG-motif cell wall-anchored protein